MKLSNNKTAWITVIAAILMCLAGCSTPAPTDRYSAENKGYTIYQFSCNGDTLGKWVSNGSVNNDNGSGGWYFEDSATHKVVELTGTVQIFVK